MKKLNTRITEYEREQIKNKCSSLLERRKGLVHKPWDSSPYKFYFNLFPADVKAAITLLNEKFEGAFHELLETNTGAVVKLREVLHKNAIELNWNGQKPCFAQGWGDGGELYLSPKHPAYRQVVKFCAAAEEINKENGVVRILVKHVAETCNTFGQIHRIWPDLLPTIGGEKVAAAEGQQRKSQLPCELETDRILLGRDDATTKLAQASLMTDLPNVFTWLN